MNGIEFFATRQHYRDHLEPIAHELELAGVETGWPRELARYGPPLVVASSRDLALASRTRRRIVLAEHGAGQAYGNGNVAYVGGRGRERVDLFLLPNERSAEITRRRYPRKVSAVVGCPRLDRLLEIRHRPAEFPRLAISFHFRGDTAPEAGTAFDHYRPGLAYAVDRIRSSGIEVLGHAHPRMAEELEPYWASIDVPFVADFADVVELADVYAVDNSSTLFEFASTGRPVLVLNSPRYRRDVELGLRFWAEADVGLPVDHVDELPLRALEALEDPPAVAAIREAAVGRVYAHRHGSARRAADAVALVMSPARRSCLVCGSNHANCGPASPETMNVVDIPERSTMSKRGALAYYPNPERPGAFLKLSPEAAKLMGLEGKAVDRRNPAHAPRPADAVTNPGAPDGPVRSSSKAVVPEGALQPGGKTSRARAEAKEKEMRDELAAEYEAAELAALAELSPDELAEVEAYAAAVAGEGEGDEDTPPAADEPKDKARRPPSRRRPAAS